MGEQIVRNNRDKPQDTGLWLMLVLMILGTMILALVTQRQGTPESNAATAVGKP